MALVVSLIKKKRMSVAYIITTVSDSDSSAYNISSLLLKNNPQNLNRSAILPLLTPCLFPPAGSCPAALQWRRAARQTAPPPPGGSSCGRSRTWRNLKEIMTLYF